MIAMQHFWLQAVHQYSTSCRPKLPHKCSLTRAALCSFLYAGSLLMMTKCHASSCASALRLATACSELCQC
jgi:hypothetical protein